MDPNTREWTDGLFTHILRKYVLSSWFILPAMIVLCHIWMSYRMQLSGQLVGLAPSTPGFSSHYYLRDHWLGTCESFFCVRIESRIESAVQFDFESNFRIESAEYTTQAVTPSKCRRQLFTPYSEYLIHSISIYFVFVTNESDARNWVLVIHFNSVLKRVKLCSCTII